MATARPPGRFWRLPFACMLAATLVACGATRLPRGTEVAGITFRTAPGAPEIVVEGPGSKGSGARRGAAAGAGGGLLLGSMLCIAAGPLAVLCAGPALAVTAMGAAGGAVVGAVAAETAAEVEAKRALLNAELARCACAEQLVATLREATAGTEVSDGWTAELRIVEAGTAGSGAGKPFAPRLVARLTLTRAAAGEPALVKDYAAVAPTARATADWQRDDRAALRAALTEVVHSLAAQILADLRAAR